MGNQSISNLAGPLTPQQIREKLRKYCSWQERAHSEVKTKLFQLKCPEDLREEILAELIEDGYLNEERFVRAYISGKYRIKKWGRVKIRSGLFQKGIHERLIETIMQEEITDEEYRKNALSVAEKWLAKYSSEKDAFSRKMKTLQALKRKGYEHALSNEVLEEVIGSTE